MKANLLDDGIGRYFGITGEVSPNCPDHPLAAQMSD